MNSNDSNAESRRLLELSQAIIDSPRGDGDFSLRAHFLGLAMQGAAALAISLVPTLIAAMFLKSQDNLVMVFCSLVVFCGCALIADAVSGTWPWRAKQFDAINALRIAVADLSNRIKPLE